MPHSNKKFKTIPSGVERYSRDHPDVVDFVPPEGSLGMVERIFAESARQDQRLRILRNRGIVATRAIFTMREPVQTGTEEIKPMAVELGASAVKHHYAQSFVVVDGGVASQNNRAAVLSRRDLTSMQNDEMFGLVLLITSDPEEATASANRRTRMIRRHIRDLVVAPVLEIGAVEFGPSRLDESRIIVQSAQEQGIVPGPNNQDFQPISLDLTV